MAIKTKNMDVNVELKELLAKCEKNKKVIEHLKHACIHGQSYALAAHIRDIEKQLFPETQEEKDAKLVSKNADLLLRMVEVGSSPSSAYRIFEAVKLYLKKKGKFDLKDACKIIADSEKIFGKE